MPCSRAEEELVNREEEKMYFPVGWPKILGSNGATKGAPVRVLRHRSKNYVVEIRENSVAFWHSRVSYVREEMPTKDEYSQLSN